MSLKDLPLPPIASLRAIATLKSQYLAPVQPARIGLGFELVGTPPLKTLADIEAKLGGPGRLSLPCSLRFLIDLLSGISLLHRTLGFLHGELQPEHVVLGEDGVGRVIPVVRPHWVRGETRSPRRLYYMAPERLMGEAADLRADVFSAGVMLWEALAGEALCEPGDADETVARFMRGGIPRPEPLEGEAWTMPLASIADRATSIDPEKRFKTVTEMRDLLERISSRYLASTAGMSEVFRHPEHHARRIAPESRRPNSQRATLPPAKHFDAAVAQSIFNNEEPAEVTRVMRGAEAAKLAALRPSDHAGLRPPDDDDGATGKISDLSELRKAAASMGMRSAPPGPGSASAPPSGPVTAPPPSMEPAPAARLRPFKDTLMGGAAVEGIERDPSPSDEMTVLRVPGQNVLPPPKADTLAGGPSEHETRLEGFARAPQRVSPAPAASPSPPVRPVPAPLFRTAPRAEEPVAPAEPSFELTHRTGRHKRRRWLWLLLVVALAGGAFAARPYYPQIAQQVRRTTGVDLESLLGHTEAPKPAALPPAPSASAVPEAAPPPSSSVAAEPSASAAPPVRGRVGEAEDHVVIHDRVDPEPTPTAEAPTQPEPAPAAASAPEPPKIAPDPPKPPPEPPKAAPPPANNKVPVSDGDRYGI